MFHFDGTSSGFNLDGMENNVILSISHNRDDIIELELHVDNFFPQEGVMLEQGGAIQAEVDDQPFDLFSFGQSIKLGMVLGSWSGRGVFRL